MKMLFDFKNLESWQKGKMKIWSFVVVFAVVFLAVTCTMLYMDKQSMNTTWDEKLTEVWTDPELVMELTQDSVPVQVGTYVENIRELSIKSGTFRIVFLTWFRWEGDEDLDMKSHFRVYKGYMNRTEVVKDYHEGGVNYQLVRCDATVTKNYWTRRFPLDSHQMKMYLECTYPLEQAYLVADDENSGMNPNMEIPGYEITRLGHHILNVEYDGSRGDPEVNGNTYTSEYLTMFEINRDSWGLYFKCFVALIGTTTWVLITLYINTYHRVDPLGMLPAALFGTVSNIMVGANLLPDALQTGLLEFVNFWGIFMILIVAVAIININRIRNKYEDKAFAHNFGRLMFYTVLTLVIVGHVLLPVCAYRFA